MMSKRGKQQSTLYPNLHNYIDDQYQVIKAMAEQMVENTDTAKLEEYIANTLKTPEGYDYLCHAQRMLTEAAMPALKKGINTIFNSLIHDSAESKHIVSFDTDAMLKSGHSPSAIADHLRQYSTSYWCQHYATLTQGVMTTEKNLALLETMLNAHRETMRISQNAGLFSHKPVHDSAPEPRRTPTLEM